MYKQKLNLSVASVKGGSRNVKNYLVLREVASMLRTITC
jgi:hypothetical protein